MQTTDTRYLELLSQLYPTSEEAAAELSMLEAQVALPKGDEYFVSDIHGEYDTFSHILRNGCGSVRRLVGGALGDVLGEDQQQQLAALIYYPAEKIAQMTADNADVSSWCVESIKQLAAVCNRAAGRCTHGALWEMLPESSAGVIEELLVGQSADRAAYVESLVASAVRSGQATALIEDLCSLIKRLAVEQLHMVGDVYDRGPAPDKIMDLLMDYHNVDIQWGNHDIVWMGASLGQRGCIAHVVRNCARYGNLDILTEGYGIDILPLATFAMEAYKDDPCEAFKLKVNPGLSESDLRMNVQIQKAMAIMQFKVEAALIDEYPSFDLADRKLLHLMDYEKGTIVVDGVEYELTDTYLPTVDRDNPYKLTDAEEAVMQHLERAFANCEKLRRHMRFLLDAGSLYKIANGNLLLHACVPLNDDGSLKEVDIFGTVCKGRQLYDVSQEWVYKAFRSTDPAERKQATDFIWYLWLGQGSPLFAKSKMATFEIYMCKDKAARKEIKNAFYKLFDQPDVYDGIFRDFGLDPQTARIINGHVPVKVKDGEDPVKAGGKVICIDGGMSVAYQKTTGIAGYTLVSGADALTLYAHEPFAGMEAVIGSGADLVSEARVVESYGASKLVADTDEGAALGRRIAGLEQLLDA